MFSAKPAKYSIKLIAQTLYFVGSYKQLFRIIISYFVLAVLRR